MARPDKPDRQVQAGRLPGTERVVLRDGSTVHIRPIEPTDREALLEGFNRLSPESRYRRFLAPTRKLDDRTLDYFTRVDHERHEALVAIDPDHGRLVGVARYVALDADRDRAEAAMAVADDWQGRGLATVLLAELTARAQVAGIDRFVATCLADNSEAIDVLGSMGPTSVSPAAAGLREVSIALTAEDSDAALRQALGHAGRGTLTFAPSRVP